MAAAKGLKLYISADLEGICGVVSPTQCGPEPDREAYNCAVRQLHREILTVAEVALASGAVESILVNDAHCSMINLDWSAMPTGVSLVSGKPKRLAMTAGLDSTFARLILLGYHAKAGAEKGVLSHTFHHRLFDVTINGQSYGEAGINTLHANLTHNVPLILASGDQAFAQELHTLLPNVPVVETKMGLGQNAARCHAWDIVEADYRTKTGTLFSEQGQVLWKQGLLALPAPYEVKITFLTPLAADTAQIIPGSQRLDGRTLQFQCDDFEMAYGRLQACYTILAATAHLESY